MGVEEDGGKGGEKEGGGEEGEVHTLREIKKSIHEISSQHQEEEEDEEREKGKEKEGMGEGRKRRKKKGVVEPKKYGDYEEEDLKFTAVAHWRYAVLSQAWNKWKYLLSLKREAERKGKERGNWREG